MNILDSLKSCLNSDAVASISEQLAESPSRVSTALSAAVPSILASLGSTATSHEGARSLMDAIRGTDDRLCGQGADAFRTGGQGLMQSGSQSMASLLGQGKVESIISAVSKFSGMGSGGVKNLINMILPMVLGFLGRSTSSAGVHDASGLAGFFQSHAASIASAIPSGFKQFLPSLPGTSWLSSAESAATEVGQRASSIAASSAPAAANAAMRYIPFLVVALLVGALAWYLWPTSPAPETYSRMPPRNVAPQAQPLIDDMKNTGMQAQQAGAQLAGDASKWLGDISTVGDPQVGKELSSTFNDLGSTLSSVTDSASAETASQKLADIGRRIDGWKDSIAKLTPEQQDKFRQILRSAMPQVENAVNKAMAIPGVKEKLGPAAQQLLEKLRMQTQAT
jgi:hypothetical protein